MSWWVIHERLSRGWRFLAGPFCDVHYGSGVMDGLCTAGWKKTLRLSSRAERWKPQPHDAMRARQRLRRFRASR